MVNMRNEIKVKLSAKTKQRVYRYMRFQCKVFNRMPSGVKICRDLDLPFNAVYGFDKIDTLASMGPVFRHNPRKPVKYARWNGYTAVMHPSKAIRRLERLERKRRRRAGTLKNDTPLEALLDGDGYAFPELGPKLTGELGGSPVDAVVYYPGGDESVHMKVTYRYNSWSEPTNDDIS